MKMIIQNGRVFPAPGPAAVRPGGLGARLAAPDGEHLRGGDAALVEAVEDQARVGERVQQLGEREFPGKLNDTG